MDGTERQTQHKQASQVHKHPKGTQEEQPLWPPRGKRSGVEDILLGDATYDLQAAPEVRRGAKRTSLLSKWAGAPTKPPGTEVDVTLQTSGLLWWMPPQPNTQACGIET